MPLNFPKADVRHSRRIGVKIGQVYDEPIVSLFQTTQSVRLPPTVYSLGDVANLPARCQRGRG
jgi:hypothetical protein